jgi:hypothetical protein
MPALEEPTLRTLYLDERQTIRHIAAALGVSPAAVNRALRRWRIPRRRRGPRVPVIDAATRAVLPTHIAVLGIRRTARQLGLAPRHIRAILGAQVLPRGGKPRVVVDAVVWSAYQNQEMTPGMSATARVAALAAQFGCSPRTIWRSLERTRNRVAQNQCEP